MTQAQVGEAQGRVRTKEVAHYVIARARPDRLGATKLNKIMWIADLAAYRQLGKTITGQKSYRKMQYGPVPNDIVAALAALKAEGKVHERSADTPSGPRREFVWLERPDASVFDAVEVDILNEVIEWLCANFSAAQISEATHDALWDEIELGEQIPIGAASIVAGEVTAEDFDWALQELAAVD